MIFHRVRVSYLLFGIFVFLGLVVTQIYGVLKGFNINVERAGWVVLLREVVYCGLYLMSFFLILKKRALGVWFFIALAYVLFLVLRSSIIDRGYFEVLSGVRVYIIVFCFYSIFFYLFNDYCLQSAIDVLLKCLLVLYFILVVFQLLNQVGFFGYTIFGPRVVGVSDNPIGFSILVAAISGYIYYFDADRSTVLWLGFCVFMCLATGGRAGIIVSMMFMFFMLFLDYRKKSFVVVIFSLFLVPILFVIFSDSAFSGRDGTEVYFLDGRIWIWLKVFKIILDEGFFSLLFGVGIGNGTNAVVNFGNVDMYFYQVSDSTFLMLLRSFGLVGFSLFVFALFKLYLIFGFRSIPYLLMIFVFSMAQSIPEQHPAYLILLLTIPVLGFQSKKTSFLNG